MTILEVVEKKVMPWAREQGRHRIVIADPATLPEQTLPEGMRVERTKLRGRRVAVKGLREYGNHCNTIARWPDDGLEEELLPFIVCVTGGQATLQAGDCHIECSEGHFLLIPPRVPYSAGDREEALLSGRIPDLMSFQTWDDRLQCGLGYRIGNSLYSSNVALIQQLELTLEEALSPRPNGEAIVAAMFNSFLALLHRDLAEGLCFGQNLVPLNASSLTPAGDPIERVMRFVKSNLGQQLSLDEAATMALMSRTQFIKRFRAATGMSFIEYVTQCRVEEVKMLLSQTDWTVTAIHKFVGLKDATQLRRIFARVVGMGLIEYRNNSRKANARAASPK